MGKKAGFILVGLVEGGVELLADIEGRHSVGVPRAGQVDFVDVFVAQTVLLGHGILARGEFLEVVADTLLIAFDYASLVFKAVVFATATASATIAFADIHGFDLVDRDSGGSHSAWLDLIVYVMVNRSGIVNSKMKKGGAGVFTPPPLGIQQRL